ncbi:luciferase family protein [Nitrosopumilus sp.]|uniref:luciferase domain-containing protein n=1 Tax=Nitrosopumilus sp. TaxID=2024843 RepID=UPI0029301291|nr:luciferase family protein [Nitrosopumilus sp.]
MTDLKFELPTREGNPPEVGKELPQIQYSDKSPEDIREKLAEWSFSSLLDVREEPTFVSIPTSRALWLDEKVESAHKEAFMLDSREFTHLHLDGSIHTMVAEDIRNEIISKGWGVKHPLDTVSVLVYAPRDEQELEILKEIIKKSYEFATGRSL